MADALDALRENIRLCVPLREPLRPLRLNFKSHKVQEAFTAEDAEDFAEVPREALQPKGVSSWYLPVADATRWDALRDPQRPSR